MHILLSGPGESYTAYNFLKNFPHRNILVRFVCFASPCRLLLTLRRRIPTADNSCFPTCHSSSSSSWSSSDSLWNEEQNWFILSNVLIEWSACYRSLRFFPHANEATYVHRWRPSWWWWREIQYYGRDRLTSKCKIHIHTHVTLLTFGKLGRESVSVGLNLWLAYVPPVYTLLLLLELVHIEREGAPLYFEPFSRTTAGAGWWKGMKTCKINNDDVFVFEEEGKEKYIFAHFFNVIMEFHREKYMKDFTSIYRFSEPFASSYSSCILHEPELPHKKIWMNILDNSANKRRQEKKGYISVQVLVSICILSHVIQILRASHYLLSVCVCVSVCSYTDS